MSFNFRTSARHPTEALTNDHLFKMAPSIFATEAHDSRSARFAFVPSIAFVDSLRKEGFFPVAALQGRSRVAGKSEFTKHIVRFRREEHIGDPRNFYQIAVPEIAFLNAHDGTSAAKWLKGWAREICTNRSVVVQETDAFSVSHKGNAMPIVIEGAFQVLGESIKVVEDMRDWQDIKLQREEQLMLASEAHMIRWESETGEPIENGIRPERLLVPLRREDTSADLATTLNVLQEHVIRGGDHGVTRDAVNNRRRVTSRGITGIDQDVKVNAALNRLAAGYARIRAAA